MKVYSPPPASPFLSNHIPTTPGVEQVRTSDLGQAAKILDVFQKYGHNEIDTSRVYGAGSSEDYLAKLDWQKRGLVMDTKFYPSVHGFLGRNLTHATMEFMRADLEASLKALGVNSVDLWYLHGPDRTVPLEQIAQNMEELRKEGKFNKWGVSNLMAWEVSALCEICDKHGWQKPSVYQGVYNAVHRTVEQELFPCLRRYGIAFYAFNPLAGGYLTDRYHRDTKDHEAGSRFDPERMQGKMYRARYWNEPFFAALDELRPVAKKHGLRESECALRWMMHHSQLKKELGDKVIIGASSETQLDMNLRDFEGETLPDDVVEALNRGWEICRGMAWKYFH
jgi:aflatoxin B1 aldehyde reductase